MASTRVDHPIRGLGLISLLFGSSTLSTADSSYTQAGPTAGGVGAPAAPTGSSAPVRAEIEGTGDQDAAVVVESLRSGNPGLGRSARIGWRLASESSTQTRTWQPPNVLNGCWSPAYSTTNGVAVDAVTLRNGKILVAYGAASILALKTWDPTTAAFTAETAPAGYAPSNVCLAIDDQGFIYCVARTNSASDVEWHVYRSQSADTTADGWDEIARDPFDTDPSNSASKYRLVQMPSGDWVFTAWFRNAGSGTIVQWASSDGCASFTQVSSTSNLSASTIGDMVVTSAGRMGLVRVTAANVANWHSTAVAWQSAISGSTAVQIATSVREAWCAVDPNGRIYVWLLSSASTDQISVSFSDDEGVTWTAMADGLIDFDADAGQFLTLGRAVFAMGEAFLYHQSSDNVATYDNSPILTRCGGWTNVAMFRGGDPDDSLGTGSGAEDTQCSWIPVSEPDDLSCWTSTGTGGDGADVFTADGRLQITTVGQTRLHTATTAPTAGAGSNTTAGGMLRVTSGGSLSTTASGFEIRASDGVNATLIAVHASSTGFTVYDGVGVEIASITVSLTTDMQFKAWVHEAGYGIVLYKRPYETTWTLALESNSVTTFASATGLVRWGAVASGNAVQEWSYFWHVSGTTSPTIGPLVSRLFSTFSSFLGPTGKPLTGLPAPLGAGSQGTSNQRLLHVRAKDGPAVLGETWTITPRYAFPISAIFPAESPSPRAVWRSTSTAENVIGFALDPTYTTSLTRNIHLSLFNVNFSIAYLEAHNGATWDTVGTWNSRVSEAMTFTRSGNVVRVNGGTAINRYLWAGEFVGGTIYDGVGVYRKIDRHTEGIWSSAAGKHAEFVLTGVDGTEAASGSGMALWATRGTLVIHGLSTLYRRWRLRIPAQDNADGYFQIGAFACGPLAAFGQQYAWGWTDVTEPNATRSQSADLVSRVRRRGPTRRTWTWAWTQLVSMRRLRNATPTPDYLGVAASTEGIANQQDVAYLAQGVLEYCRSGEVPMVALKSISATSGTMITDRTLFMLGRLNSSVGFENELGDETAGEVGRISPISLEELV